MKTVSTFLSFEINPFDQIMLQYHHTNKSNHFCHHCILDTNRGRKSSSQIKNMANQGEDSNKITELSYREKVPVAAMKEIIHECLIEKLTNQQYEGEKCNEAAKILADLIRNRLKNLGYDRYKFVVQVLIGERREQGVYFGSRCFWDVNTDNQASDSFTNVSKQPCDC